MSTENSELSSAVVPQETGQTVERNTSVSTEELQYQTLDSSCANNSSCVSEGTASESDKSSDYEECAVYVPPVYHWFHEELKEKKKLWVPFSVADSAEIEKAFLNSRPDDKNVIVSTDGGRFDVYVNERLHKAVYWSGVTSSIRRCLWFYRCEGQSEFIPYSEEFSMQLETVYRKLCMSNTWHEKIQFGDQFFMFNGPNSVVEYEVKPSCSSEWSDASESHFQRRYVRRGIQDSDVDSGEPDRVDHLVFLVHGVGYMCDWKLRNITEVVDEFRSISFHLSRTHFKEEYETNKIGRVEYLPVSWHEALHGDATGIDDRLKLITLPSIPRLRGFSNDVILDALFYTSPVYCQTIIDAVAFEINRLFRLFKSRNPRFNGSVAVVGHSLGSLILFDILAHQSVPRFDTKIAANTDKVEDIETLCSVLNLNEYLDKFKMKNIDLNTILTLSDGSYLELGIPLSAKRTIDNFLENSRNAQSVPSSESLSRKSSVTSVSYNFGSPGTGHPFIKYPQLDFAPKCFFALGSPISMFLTVRGIETLKDDFRLPTCPRVFNIFHPNDPIAYRIEPLINPLFTSIKPVLIPHHKGRKRMHLELKENLFKVGSDLKHKVVESIKLTWNSINDFARRSSVSLSDGKNENNETGETSSETSSMPEASKNENENDEHFDDTLNIGQLSSGHRIDFVLQETPMESFNEYIFSIVSHACYWESEDTALLLLKQMYSSR